MQSNNHSNDLVTSLYKVMNMVNYRGANIEVAAAGCKVFNQTCSCLSDAKKMIDDSYVIIQQSINKK